jgi:hypothetical protein
MNVSVKLLLLRLKYTSESVQAAFSQNASAFKFAKCVAGFGISLINSGSLQQKSSSRRLITVSNLININIFIIMFYCINL